MCTHTAFLDHKTNISYDSLQKCVTDICKRGGYLEQNLHTIMNKHAQNMLGKVK
jgi:hypothetical protein